MALTRQQAFEQLRGPCVELSSIALRFKAKQVPVKDVLRALEALRKVLSALGKKNALDEKLAEYAFFPLTHVFNEAQRLSSSCLEAAVNCIITLSAKGWRHHLSPDMGKQLLILMTLVGAPDTKKQANPPSDELKEASLVCIGTIVVQLSGRQDSKRLFDDVGTRSIVDQLVYMLLESMTENESDHVQLAAAESLLALVSAISSRILLASLLPRTASSLTQVLKPSSKARRTRKVLTLYLKLLTLILFSVLADRVTYPLENSTSSSQSHSDNGEVVALDGSWLEATTSQVKLVITQVTKLRHHQSPEVRQAVAELCLAVARDCSISLSGSMPIVVESLLAIVQSEGDASLSSSLEGLARADAGIAEIIRNKFYFNCQSLPRLLQGNDDRPKARVLKQIESCVSILDNLSPLSSENLHDLTKSLLASFGGKAAVGQPPKLLEEQFDLLASTNVMAQIEVSAFESLALSLVSERTVLLGLRRLLDICAYHGLSNRMARICIDQTEATAPEDRFTAIWVTLACLRAGSAAHDVSSMIDIEEDDVDSRPQLISELYHVALPFLLEEGDSAEEDSDRLKALAIECVVLQAQQLGSIYRPELVESLYPILSLLGSQSQLLRNHAMTGLNLSAQACGYSSTSEMLIDNVDYLINSVALKLNSFNISPQAPQVVLMMLRLCGARILPYLDDLIGSLFSALDNFHGYTRLVELLFQILKAVVEESRAHPDLTIMTSMLVPKQSVETSRLSQIEDIINDLRRRKCRKRKHEINAQELEKAPHRPWKANGSQESSHEFEDQIQSIETENEGTQDALPRDEDPKKQLSKTHQLLLDIAKSTSPHLSSPSPQVRHLLLGLIEGVAPLLAQDENTFLLWINAVWPSIVARMLSLTDDSQSVDVSYNVCAAIDAINVLCKGAGSFMSTRVEAVFPQICRLFDQVSTSREQATPRGTAIQDQYSLVPSEKAPTTSALRKSRSQVLAAMLKLLVTIIDHVRVTEDMGDNITKMLAPFAMKQERSEIRLALDKYNSDAVWFLERNAGRWHVETTPAPIEVFA